jgi:hypothetical protein
MEKTVGEIGILNSDLFSDQFFLQCSSFVKTSLKRSFSFQTLLRDISFSLFWKRLELGVVFENMDCVEGGQGSHIGWKYLTRIQKYTTLICSF